MVITVYRSKTDPNGKGRRVAIVYGRNSDTRPVRALKAWMDEAWVLEGPVFRKVNSPIHRSLRRKSRAQAVSIKWIWVKTCPQGTTFDDHGDGLVR